jgi:four helix bundle protein
MRDAARSAKQNIREGYRKGTIGEFIRGIIISLGSLEELSGDIEDCHEDSLITKEEFHKFNQKYKSASYLANQYLRSAYKMEREGTWKIPGWRLRKKKVTSRNLPKPPATSRNSRKNDIINP